MSSATLGNRTSAHDRASRAGKLGARRANKESKPHPATQITYTYDQDEMDFMLAVDRFKVRTGRKFPTLADLLQVAKSIGFTRTAPYDIATTTNSEGR